MHRFIAKAVSSPRALIINRQMRRSGVLPIHQGCFPSTSQIRPWVESRRRQHWVHAPGGAPRTARNWGSHSFHTFIEPRATARDSGPFIAGGQRVDVRIVEKSVVAVPPRVGLWREESRASCQPAGSLYHRPLLPGCQGPRPLYLRADTEVVVGDESGSLLVLGVEPGVEGAEGHARESQHEGQKAPGAGCNRERQE